MGGPPSHLGCALGSLGQWLARVKSWGAAPPNGRNVVSRKIYTGVGQYEPLYLCCLWTKVHHFFLPNVEGVVVDNGSYRLSIWRSVPKIFAIKVESCQKLCWILDIFTLSQASLPKIVHALSPLTCGTSTGKSYMSVLSLDPKLLWLIRWILGQINFHD